MSKLMIVDDDNNMRTMLSKILHEDGYEVVTAKNGKEAMNIINKERNINLIITDLKMPEASGMDLLAFSKENFPEIAVVMITAHGTIENAVQAMKSGASDYITKPFNIDEIRLIIKKVLEIQKLKARDIYIGSSKTKEKSFKEMIGESSKMQEIYKIVNQVSPADSTVLIQGESGTGKELIARAIHNNSKRLDKPYIAVNCAALSETLLESELFGHEKGAFTGAISRHPGRFELADTGTLFLDEISELPLFLQSKLLRVLQEREFERVGGTETIKIDVRVISATSRDIKSALKEGKFREDLFYRLNVVPIYVPPLKDRKDDIPLLINYFLANTAKKLGKEIKKISESVRNALIEYNWPGNIRELENTIERMTVLCQKGIIDIEDVPAEIMGKGIRKDYNSLKEAVQSTTEVIEKQHIIDSLKKTNGNITKAAILMQVTRVTLQNKLKYYNINAKNIF